MRAALLVLVVACGSQDPIAIDILTSPQGVSWYISPGASCTCQNVETFPTSGSCTKGSDTSGCTCYPGACLGHVSLLQAGSVIGGADVSSNPVPSTLGGFTGDFTQADLSLRFEGCGEDAVAPLGNAFPDAVTPTVSQDKTQVSWSIVSNDGFLVSVGAEFTGELCRADPDAASQRIDLGYYTNLSVSTLRGPVASTSGSISFQLWSTN